MTSSRERLPLSLSSYLEDFADALAKAPGYDFDGEKTEKSDDEGAEKIIGTVTNSPVYRVPPRVLVGGGGGINGQFSDAGEDFLNVPTITWRLVPVATSTKPVFSLDRVLAQRPSPQFSSPFSVHVRHDQHEQLQAHAPT